MGWVCWVCWGSELWVWDAEGVSFDVGVGHFGWAVVVLGRWIWRV